ncbi:hypothetical protein HY345_01085 [Candidatus Microgenomates bacterium]|nr:hypothetical protein [Candidatus Microgenomates bacterium]
MAKGTKLQGKQLLLTGPVIMIRREPAEPKDRGKENKPLGRSELSQRLAAAVENELKENGSDGRLTLTNAWRRVRKESQ